MKLYTFVVHYLQMRMKEYGCCPTLKGEIIQLMLSRKVGGRGPCRLEVWETTLFSLYSQLYHHLCIWKSSLNSRLLGKTDCLHWIWAVLKKYDSFSFYLSIAVLRPLLVIFNLIAANENLLLLYACAHKISLKYLFQEQIAMEICC